MTIGNIGVMDIFVIFIFVFCNIGFALVSRGRKKSFGEYAIGNGHHFSDITIVLTTVATYASGSLLIHGVQQSYIKGLSYIIMLIIMDPLSYVLYSLFVVPKMTMRSFSIYEYLGHFYGDKVRCLLALTEVLAKIGYLAIQLTVIGIAAEMIFGCGETAKHVLMCLSALFLGLYTAFGGLKSVSVTDICQSLFFMCTIVFLAFYILSHDEVQAGFFAQFDTTSDRMSLKSCFQNWTVALATLAMWAKAVVPWHSTPLYQRVLMAETPWRARRLMFLAILIYTTINMMVVYIGLQVYGVDSSLKIKEIWPFIIKTFSFKGLNGVIFVGICALVISTVDSHLNAASVVITNDILPAIHDKFKVRQYKTAVLVTFIWVFLALLFALKTTDIFKLLMYSGNFNLPVTILILSTVLGFRTHTNVIWTAIISAFVATVSYSFFMRGTGFAQYAFFPGMCACGASLILGHLYYTKIKGWENDKKEPYYDPYTPEQNAAMHRRGATGEWKTPLEKAMYKRKVEERYKESIIEKMKLTIEEYEEEKAKKEKEVNQVIENVRKNILDGKDKEKNK
ncbi:MAG: sodium:solute symporter family protein [Cytophagales bacterium]|nr:sodium:solute symporter family protein [Cytophagales bacterium]